MSILIKGVEMPKDCSVCPCFQYDMFDDDIDGYCKALETKIMNRSKRHPDCPLVELPEKHGRLVDADKLADLLSKEKEKVVGEGNLFLCFAVGFAWGFIIKEPTVVEAEGSET